MGTTWRNVRRGEPCVICGKPDWCSRSDDGAWALCRRIDAGGRGGIDRSGAEYWLHPLGSSSQRAPEVSRKPRPGRAELADLDRVYRTVLGSLTLAAKHGTQLRGRGLEEQAIEEGMYATLPSRGRAALARTVLERFPARLLGTVPGFCVREGGSGSYLSFAGPAGLLVPVRDLNGRVVALKVRRDEPGDEGKYVYVSSTGQGGPGPGAPVHVPPWHGPTRKVRVTEGELKADVATRLSGTLTISVPGVSAWRGALPVLTALAPERVLLAFDADASTNAHVARATEATADALVKEGYEVALETWDAGVAKGIDDALLAGIPLALHSHGPLPDAPACNSDAACYRATPDGLFWDRPTRDGALPVRLANFRAAITADILHDDGAELRRSFEVEARLNGDLRRLTVTADAFAAMNWVTEQLGARAIVYPGLGLKDHTRAAVQLLSGKVAERHIFTHTGWRLLEQGWGYLHAGGAIGAAGSLSGIDVALPEALSRFALPAPPTGTALLDAVRASLALLDAAPDVLTVPLLSAVYRSILGHKDFSLLLAGPTGAGKSEMASLGQRHFGPDMDARHLPGSWSSTANALEALAFAAKDAVLVVDDFAPGGSSGDTERAHRDADRLLRAQGNRSGRLRMRSDGTLQTSRPPRGLILSTGEDLPKGQSLRGRLLVCELGPSDVDWGVLGECQRHAAQGVYAQALSGFIAWVAARYDQVQESLKRWVPDIRQAATASTAHRRTPEIVAHLAGGLGLFLTFARTAGTLNQREQEELWSRAWAALGEAAKMQAQHQRAGEPARRFLELLLGAIASGRAHLAGPDGDRPQGEEAWGWRHNHHGGWEPKGERVGWVDGDHVYLEPDAAYAAVQRLGEEVGDRLALTPQTLRRRLKEDGVLASSESKRRMLTVRRTLEGHRREVLHLHRATVLLTVPDAASIAQTQSDQTLWSASAPSTVSTGSAPSTSGNTPRPAAFPSLVGLVGISAGERGML